MWKLSKYSLGPSLIEYTTFVYLIEKPHMASCVKITYMFLGPSVCSLKWGPLSIAFDLRTSRGVLLVGRNQEMRFLSRRG